MGTGMVDKRTLEKYEKEAKEKNRESCYLSWAIDTNQEERDKGKTVEVGRAYFETETKHFTILDAPGHRSFVPNMIGGASQADVAVLVIYARRGEFETGFERGGQTREHAMLVKTAGVKSLVIVVNKMDDPTVDWDESRFDEIKEKLNPYLKKVGFNPKTDLFYLPVSGLTGAFLRDESARESCPWYTGPSLVQYLDGITPVSRAADGPLRIPVVDRYKDMGTIVLGKVESGSVARGDQVMLMPNRSVVEVMQLWSDEEETERANPGENVKVKLKGVEEEDVSAGFVLSREYLRDVLSVRRTSRDSGAQVNHLRRVPGGHAYPHVCGGGHDQGPHLQHRQEDGREELNAAALHQARPNRHRAVRDHGRRRVPRALQAVPADGPVHSAGRGPHYCHWQSAQAHRLKLLTRALNSCVSRWWLQSVTSDKIILSE